jgi:hypothetical protein
MVLGNAYVKLAAAASDGTYCPVAMLSSLNHVLISSDHQCSLRATLHSQNVPKHFTRGHVHADVSICQTSMWG